jgi:glycosyltransferase involved in cell wall biosynthesis
MKIALVVPGFSAHEQDWCIPALLDYVRVLARQVEVHVFTLRWPERGGTYPVFGATVHALEGRRRLGARVVSLWARAAREVAAEHRRGPFDVIHAFWLDEPGWVAAWTGRRLGVPVVLSLAGGEVCRLPNIGYGLLLLRGRGLLLRAAARQAARVTAGSRYLSEAARHYFGRHGMDIVPQVAPLGVELTRFAPPAAPVSTMRLLNVGSLVPVKDQARLVRVFGQVAAAAPAAELWIAGEGPLRADLARLAAGLRVQFLGSQPHDSLPEVYHAGALLVQTSLHEAQGMAVLEAAACGVPVMGTAVGVLPEVGRVAVSDAELREAMLELLRDNVARAAQAEAALAVVRAEFALEAAVARFVDLYADLRG